MIMESQNYLVPGKLSGQEARSDHHADTDALRRLSLSIKD
jgi:hypothetical protein